MKKLLFFFIYITNFSLTVSSQTILNAGDIAVFWNQADTPDNFAFVTFVDLDAGTGIYFTDCGTLANGSFSAPCTEGAQKYLVPPGGLKAGAVITFNGNSDFSSFTESGVITGTISLATTGDQIIVFQDSTNPSGGAMAASNAKFIFAIHNASTAFNGDPSDTNETSLPNGLSDTGLPRTALGVGAGAGVDIEYDNTIYTGSYIFSNINDAKIALTNPANYYGSNDNPNGATPDATYTGHVNSIPNKVILQPTWLGTTNTDWATASNWSHGSIPTNSDNIAINNVTNKPIISNTTGAVTNNLTINTGATLTIESGGSLIVSGTSKGNITYKRTLTNNWHLVSSPVNDETVQDLIANHTFAIQGGGNITMAPYNNNGSAWNYYTNGSSGSITPGTGLSAKLSAAADLSFTGTINTSNVPYNITQGTANNYNLVGNPFTSYINLGTFFTNNNGKFSEGTIWMWNQAANKYDLKMSVADASFQIAPGQGFFVSAGSNTSINFNTTNQSHQTDTFQRSSRTEINLTATENGKSKSTKIYYVNGATKGFDFGYDGSMFNTSNRFALYSQLVSENQGKNYAIQSLPINEIENITIPIGLNAKADKKIDFSITSINLPNNTKVYIEDRVNNKFIDITDTNHSITLKNDVNGIGRFYLHTSSKKLDTPVATIIEDVSFYKSAPNTLSVAGLQSQKASLKIYSLIGQKIVDQNFKSNGFSTITIPYVSAGVYIVELSSELGKISKKIVLE